MSTTSLSTATVGLLLQRHQLLRGKITTTNVKIPFASLQQVISKRTIHHLSSSSTTPSILISTNHHHFPQTRRTVTSKTTKYAFIDSTSSTSTSSSSSSTKTALVIGSSGILGKTIVQHLSSNLKMTVIGADIIDPKKQREIDLLDAFIPLQASENSAKELTASLSKGMREISGDEEGKERVLVDAIICASGGWEGDPPYSPPPGEEGEQEDAAKSWGETLDKMLHMNLHPVMAAGYVAERHMAGEGLFVAIGAAAALTPTPGMAAYGAAKAATHHYIQTLGATTGLAIGHKQIRKESKHLRKYKPYLDDMTALAILPTMIDTPMNRKFASPKDDFDTWTKPVDIAEEIGMWIENPYLRPNSGSLIKVYPPKFSGGGGDGGSGERTKSTFGLVR